MPKKVLSAWFLLFAFFVNAQDETTEAKKTYLTSRATQGIVIDGKLDDPAWNDVEWGGDFVGHQPEYKANPTEPTQFKILYDSKFLYVGVRAFDSEPDKIVKRMSRRDGFDGDWVEINIDSYFDQRSAFSFTASVSGVKGDEYISNNGDNWDSTWDPIWYLKTSVDSLGWIAEFKIPLSQLRFANKESHIWGIQLTRRYFRNEERSTWQPINPTAPGWVHLFGELHGIVGIKPQKQLEIQPYIVGTAQKFPKEEENPFRSTGKEISGDFGIDAKIGITSDVTLDLTVNPDFGQVESDPSAVNLTAFRLFFREQRPFFLEGNNTLTFPTSGGRNNLYYSRRIGARPKGYPNDGDIAYVNMPQGTRILGAAKLTGKNANGFSWGILDSYTNREIAGVIDTLGAKRHEKVEPYTNYVVTRVQQDIDAGKTVVGAFLSNVNRFGNNSNGLELLHDNAQSGGFDIDHNFVDRKYGIVLRGMVSRVQGSEKAIYETQTSSERYFQRIDNNHRQIDSTRTLLSGSAATFTFGKRSGNWRWTLGSNYRSPGLELNDLGFLVQTDNVNNWMWSQYRVTKPTKLFRSQRYSFHYEQNLDFGGMQTRSGGELNMGLQFNNLWFFGQGVWVDVASVSNADLRGGPSFQYPGGINYWYEINTNRRKKVSLYFNNWFYWGNQDYTKNTGIEASINVRPIDALSISVTPNISWGTNDLQYIEQFDLENETKYLLGRINQGTYSTSFRLNYNVTPNLTVELWAQPFIAKGEYGQFKWVSQSTSNDYFDRFSLIDENTITYNLEDVAYRINENTGHEFDDPDFNIVEFRSNFVFRWEYIPGSTLFFVWSNNSSHFDQSERNNFNQLSSKLNNLDGNNTFLIKYTYRFIL
ncbi:MAG: hypothetical protein ACJA08_000618 [Cyclobacteriaceae bacterium]|jgi:hypothetical protein